MHHNKHAAVTAAYVAQGYPLAQARAWARGQAGGMGTQGPSQGQISARVYARAHHYLTAGAPRNMGRHLRRAMVFLQSY